MWRHYYVYYLHNIYYITYVILTYTAIYTKIIVYYCFLTCWFHTITLLSNITTTNTKTATPYRLIRRNFVYWFVLTIKAKKVFFHRWTTNISAFIFYLKNSNFNVDNLWFQHHLPRVLLMIFAAINSSKWKNAPGMKLWFQIYIPEIVEFKTNPVTRRIFVNTLFSVDNYRLYEIWVAVGG